MIKLLPFLYIYSYHLSFSKGANSVNHVTNIQYGFIESQTGKSLRDHNPHRSFQSSGITSTTYARVNARPLYGRGNDVNNILLKRIFSRLFDGVSVKRVRLYFSELLAEFFHTASRVQLPGGKR